MSAKDGDKIAEAMRHTDEALATEQCKVLREEVAALRKQIEHIEELLIADRG